MNKMVKFAPMGNSTAVLVSREMLAASGFVQGGNARMKASPGKIEIEAVTDDFDEQMEIAREVMRRRFDALRQLAK